MNRQENKRPIISIETVYGNCIGGEDHHGHPIDEAITLEAYRIASTLMYWSLKPQHVPINHIKVAFCEIYDSVIVNFKLTIKPLNNDPFYIFEAEWNKRKCREMPRSYLDTIKSLHETLGSFHDAIPNCESPDQVIDGIKKILYAFIARLSEEKIKNGQHLKKLAQTIE